MKCAEIPAFLREDGSGKTRCKRLAEQLCGCDCEAESVEPNLSPGVIRNYEVLLRYVPLGHIDTDTRTIKPSLFSHAGQWGMSVDRNNYRTAESETQVKTEYVGVVQATADAVRAISDDLQRCFAVYDTALANNRAHADVCQIKFFTRSRDAEFRRRLGEKFLHQKPTWFEDGYIRDT